MKSLAVVLVLALIWLAGLGAFAARVQRSTPAAPPDPADGVVALTGANSNERIAAAVDQLTRQQLRAASGSARRIYDCCVDLGFTAVDTIGNARETAEWARSMRFRKLTIVTSDYHMPRAMLELRAVLRAPDFQLQTLAVPTQSLKARRWWRSSVSARLMVVEYCKYLVILTREAVLGLGPRDPVASPPH